MVYNFDLPHAQSQWLNEQFTGDVWMELLSSLFQASQSNDAGMRECAFRIFATMPGIIEKQHESAVQEVFGKGFKDNSVDVRTTPGPLRQVLTGD
jgi:hypothetical protein